jgi:DNA-directed RNA polymerase specialized sigma24 family protein
MGDTHLNSSAVLRACQAAVEALVAERKWELLDRAMWVEQTFAEVLATSLDPRRAAIYIYSQALYQACSGAQGDLLRETGYGELFRYLYDIARRRYSLIYEDVAQQAVELVYHRFAQCHQPGTFLAFALHQMLAAARIVRRQTLLRRPAERSSQEALNAFEYGSFYPSSDPSVAAITNELRARFEQLSIEFLRKHPRAWMQLEALRLKYIDGLDEAAISQRLGKPAASVYVLRARAVEKLRAEPAWRALAIEFGVLPGADE